MTCDHRWRAGRVEVPLAVVLHVCDLPMGHAEPHHCACGATKENVMEPCQNCGGHIFPADHAEDGSIIWSHLEDTNCDDPEPKENA